MSEKGEAFYKAILDAIPIMIFIVDDDVRCVDFNRAAEVGLLLKRGEILNLRGGEILHCLHAWDNPAGCGRGEACKSCVVRNSVRESRSGVAVVRKRTRLDYLTEGEAQSLEILVTANAMEFENRLLTILAFEDISEMTKLRDLVPICARCKKVRSDKNYWQSVEEFFSKSSGVDFSHGLCPDCLRTTVPDYKGEYDNLGKGEKK